MLNNYFIFTTVLFISLHNPDRSSENVYRSACIVKVQVICCVLLMLPQGLRAQQYKYYQQALPVYPLTEHLFSGLVSNKGKAAEGQVSYTLHALDLHVSDSFLLEIKPGIGNLLSDSFIAGSGLLNRSARLVPGDYSFAMKLIIGADTLQAQRAFRVPPYRLTLEKEDSNRILVLTEPPVKDAGIYVCVRKDTRKRKRGKPAGCFYTTENVLDPLKFRPDTFATYTYQLSIYAQERLVGRTDFKSWEELKGDIMPGDSAAMQTATTRTRGMVQLNATAGVEYGYTNVRYASQLSATQYARFFFKPTLTILGVPLTFNSMLSTENSSNYPLNFFQFGFDAGKFRSDFQNNAIKDQLETAHRFELNTAALGDVNRLLAKYKRPAFSAPGKGQENSLDSSLKRRLGSRRRARKMEELDMKIQGLEARKQSLEYERYKDSVYLNARKWNEPELDTVQRFLKKQRYKNLTRTLLAIRSFNIGLCSPHYSDLTLSQVPLQGMHADLKFNKWYVSATAGNRITFQPTLGLRALLQPRFENKTYAGKLGISNRRTHTSVYVAYFYFENKPDSFNHSPQQNTILSAGIENHFLPRVLFTAELAKSFYQGNHRDAFSGERYNLSNSFNKAYGNVSFNSSLVINATRNTDLSASIKRIGNGYYTLGIPFLRNDYMEYTLGWKQFYWLRQLETELSYMQNRDNLEGNKAHTTILTGYGATLKTHFRTRPNLLVMYKPFNSSFSFEENLFNPVNTQPNIITQQFYLFHATVFYTRNIKQAVLLNSSLSYNRSNNHHSTGSVYRLETVSSNIGLSDKQGRQLAYVVSLYRSSIPSNNAMLHDVSCSAGVIKNKIRATLGGIAQWVNDGRQRTGLYGQASYALKTFTISCRLSSNYIQGNWFVNNPAFEHAVNVFLEWRL